MQKSELSSHAKVGDSQEAKLFQNELSRHLNLNRSWGEEVLESEWSNLHDVSDVKRVDPLVLVQVAKDVFHVSVSNLQS